MKHTIETAIEEWIKQGRSEEQIYGVRNFMSGRGERYIKENFVSKEEIKTRVEKVIKRLKNRLEYCQKQNGLPFCKNCSLTEDTFAPLQFWLDKLK
jgi:hypothetical protein